MQASDDLCHVFLAEPGKSGGPISWAMRLGVKAGGPKSDKGVEKETPTTAGPEKSSVESQGTSKLDIIMRPGRICETLVNIFCRQAKGTGSIWRRKRTSSEWK